MIISIVTILTILYITTVILFLVGLQQKKTGTSTDRYRVTVIIAARNEEDNIGHILNDLCNQTYPLKKYNIIVVNDGSTDRTQEVIDSYTKKASNINTLAVRHVPKGTSPKKYALQLAIEQSDSDLVLSTDADCRVPPTWIETMVSYFTPDVGFVIGFSQYGRPRDKQNLIENLQAFDFLQMMGVAAGTSNLGLPMAASGQNLAYRRDAFVQVGGYSKIAHRISGDDVLLLQLIRRYTSYKAVFAADPQMLCCLAGAAYAKGFYQPAYPLGFQRRLPVVPQHPVFPLPAAVLSLFLQHNRCTCRRIFFHGAALLCHGVANHQDRHRRRDLVAKRPLLRANRPAEMVPAVVPGADALYCLCRFSRHVR